MVNQFTYEQKMILNLEKKTSFQLKKLIRKIQMPGELILWKYLLLYKIQFLNFISYKSLDNFFESQKQYYV